MAAWNFGKLNRDLLQDTLTIAVLAAEREQRFSKV
jgi:hypothetical protein